MDFLGNIFLGIRIFDWIVLVFLLSISARTFGVRDSLTFLEDKVSELWVKLVHNKKDEPLNWSSPLPNTSSEMREELERHDEDIPNSDKKEKPKKESTFIGTTFKILFAIVGFIVIVGIVNTYK
tara:strand:- start:219 stop:590 length:372 start_codon:yes stop_codon:yes gene_type:complete